MPRWEHGTHFSENGKICCWNNILNVRPKGKILACWKSGNIPSIIFQLTKPPSSSLLLHISVKFQKWLCCFSETWKWPILMYTFYKRVLIMKLHNSIFWKFPKIFKREWLIQIFPEVISESAATIESHSIFLPLTGTVLKTYSARKSSNLDIMRSELKTLQEDNQEMLKVSMN